MGVIKYKPTFQLTKKSLKFPNVLILPSRVYSGIDNASLNDIIEDILY
jgi:hypothetical protein